MQLNKSRNFLFLLFGVLYFVQGVIQAYQLNFFKPHMAQAGIDPDRIGLVATLALVPFIIKWIFGLVSDRVNLFGLGYRKPYMLIGVIGCAIAFAIAYFVDPSQNFGIVAAMVLAATFFMALFDTTADALAVDTTSEEDYNAVQGFMTGGRAAGLIILSFIFGRIADQVGFNAIFLVIAACLLIPLFLLSQIKEPAQRSAEQAFDGRVMGIMLKPAYVLFALFLIVAWTAFQGVDGLVTLYMSEALNIDVVQIGNYGTIKGIGMVGGALLSSLLVKRFGQQSAALATIALVTVGGLVFSTLTTLNSILLFGIIWGVFVGLNWTVYAAVSMQVTDLRVAGTMFALLQTMANIGLGVGDGLTAALTDNLAYADIFRVFAALNLVALPLFLIAYRLFGRMPELKIGSQQV